MAMRGYPKSLIDLIHSFKKSKILFAACELGVFDKLHKNGPSTAARVASDLKCNPDSMRRLLNSCAGLQLIIKQNDGMNDMYCNSELANLHLIKESPTSLHGATCLYSNVVYPLFDKLAEGIKSGGNQLQNALNIKGNNIFEPEEGYYSSPEIGHTFLAGLHSIASHYGPYVVSAFDLSKYQTVCDLGGATGKLAECLSERYPKMNITVLDLPHAINQFDKLTPKQTQNITFIAGDFFEDEIPPANLYILCQVIHAFSEDKVEILIKKIFNTLSKGGALLLCETMLNENEDGPELALFHDLMMLLGAHGKERKGEDYKDILEKQGFVNVKTKYYDKYLDVILAHKI